MGVKVIPRSVLYECDSPRCVGKPDTRHQDLSRKYLRLGENDIDAKPFIRGFPPGWGIVTMKTDDGEAVTLLCEPCMKDAGLKNKILWPGPDGKPI